MQIPPRFAPGTAYRRSNISILPKSIQELHNHSGFRRTMRFLCLHGMGVSNEIFQMQTAAVRHELGEDHSYEFVQGTIEWPMAPELEHLSDATKPHFAYHKNTPESALDALAALDGFLASETPFDGILAFSQGAGLALAYTRYYLHLYPERALPFLCLLLFSPVGLSDPVLWLQTGELQKLVCGASPFNIPIAVVIGEHDLPQVKLETENIHELVQAKLGCWKYVHSGGHVIPNGNAKEELKGTVRALRRAIAQVHIMEEGK